MPYFGYGPQGIDVGGYGYRWYQQPPPPIVDQQYTEEEAVPALYRGDRCVRYLCYVLQSDLIPTGAIAMRDMRINCDADSEIPTSMTGRVRAQDAAGIDWSAIRLQPAMQIQMPDGGWYEWPLGVFLPITPRPRHSATGSDIDLSGYDMTVILRDDKLEAALTIPAGTPYIDAVTAVVTGAGIQHTISDRTDAALEADLQFDIGTSRLYIANTLLRAINYDPIWADEHGYINMRRAVLPYDRAVKHRYIDDQMSVLAPEIDEDLDSFEVPNVIIGVVSRPEAPPLVARWENTEPASPLSIARRGRRVVRVDELDDAFDQDALESYVRMEGYRTLSRYGKVRFETLTMPAHTVRDMLYLSRKDAGVEGRYMEIGWSMDLRAGVKMQHTAQRVVIV